MAGLIAGFAALEVGIIHSAASVQWMDSRLQPPSAGVVARRGNGRFANGRGRVLWRSR